MATAPTPGGPGTTSHAEAVDNAKQIMKMTVRGETRCLALGNIPDPERFIVRKATGLPIEAFLGENTIAEDSLRVVWWLAARAAGNKHLTYTRASAEWPNDLTEDDVEVEMVDADDVNLPGDDPES